MSTLFQRLAALISSKMSTAPVTDYFLGLSNPAAMVVDMQPAFVSQLPGYVFKEIANEQLMVLRVCAERDIPVFYLEDYDDHPTIRIISEALEKVPRVTKVVKHRDDGFIGTNLRTVLDEHRIHSLVVMGVFADQCVLDTAHSALIRFGYRVRTSELLIADATWTGLNPKAHSWYEAHGCFA